MTHWYVQSVGVGSGGLLGQDPFNAINNINSLTLATSLRLGDFVWIARNYWTRPSDVATHYFQVAPSWAGQGGARVVMAGWPSSADPLFDLRPIEARSAGWDSHVGFLSGMNYPFLVTSIANTTSNRFVFVDGVDVYNLIMANSTGAAPPATPPVLMATLGSYVYMHNVFLLHEGPCGDTFLDMGKMNIRCNTGQFSSPNERGVLAADFSCEELVVLSGTLTAGGILNTAFSQQVRSKLKIEATSIAYLAGHLGGTAVNAFDNPQTPYAKSVAGNTPYLGGVYPDAVEARGAIITVDDYFGLGPHRFGMAGHTYRYLANSGDAMYNSGRVRGWFVNSAPAASLAYFQQAYQKDVVFRMNVSANTSYALQWPLYTRVHSLLSTRPPRIAAYGQGGDFNQPYVYAGSANLQAGSATPWTGGLPTGGTPYILVGTFVPNFSGVAEFALSFGLPNVSTPATAPWSGWIGAAVQPIVL